MARQILTAVNGPQAGPDPLTGTLTARFGQQNADMLVYRLSLQGVARSIALVNVGGGGAVTLGTYRSISYFGQQDDADYPGGLLVPAGQQLFLIWQDISGGIATPVNITTDHQPGTVMVQAEVEI